jgi:hypothetical protein
LIPFPGWILSDEITWKPVLEICQIHLTTHNVNE